MLVPTKAQFQMYRSRVDIFPGELFFEIGAWIRKKEKNMNFMVY